MTCARATSVLCSFSVVRLCECGMCVLLPHQHAITATFYVCVIVLIYFAQLPQCARRWVS